MQHEREFNGLSVYNGSCIGFNKNYNGIYCYVMDSIVGMFSGKWDKEIWKWF